VVFPEGSRLRPRVDRALGNLVANGTVTRISRVWLSTDPRTLPVIAP
jgi:hypothetical protein